MPRIQVWWASHYAGEVIFGELGQFSADLGIGFVLALVTFLVFSKLLSLTLPVGPLERLL